MMKKMYSQPSRLQQLLANRRLLLVAGGLLLAIIVGIVLLTSSGGKDLRTSLQHLSVRYDSVVTVVQRAGSNNQISSDDLAKLNAEASSVLTSDETAVTSLAKNYGEIPQDIQTAEADTSSAGKLDNAKLTNTFDTTYSRLLRDKLTALIGLIDEARSETSATNTLSVLNKAKANTNTLLERLTSLKL